MRILDLKAKEAVSASDECKFSGNADYLLLGRGLCQDYVLHLYFALPLWHTICERELEQARLVLYKKPLNNICNCYSYDNDTYGLYPLLDFFNVYGCKFCPPAVDRSMEVIFENANCSSYTEIDITDIVKAWMSGEIENKGLLLMGYEDSPLVSYASSNFAVSGMRPMLRLIYKDVCEEPSLRCITSTVVVSD